MVFSEVVKSVVNRKLSASYPGQLALSAYPGPSVQRRLGKEREIFPTSLKGDVTSEIAEDDWK